MTGQLPPPPPGTQPPGTTAPKKAWWKRWWGVTLIVIAVFAALGALLDDDEPADERVAVEEPDEEPEPVEEPEPEPEPEPELASVPDLVGMTLDQARDLAEEAGVELDEVDANRDRTIWNAENWTVETQSPDAGTEADPGSPVTVEVANEVDDREPTTIEIDASVSFGPGGLTITPDIDLWNCTLDVNPGFIRSGYTLNVEYVQADVESIFEWRSFTASDGERFSYASHAPEMLSARCDDGNGTTMLGTWGVTN